MVYINRSFAMMLIALQIYALFHTLTAISAECILEESTTHGFNETITCTNTSAETYVYELLELFSTYSEYSPPTRTSFGFRIRNSNFSAATSLVNPRFAMSTTKNLNNIQTALLSLNFCGLKSIGKDRFIEFPELVELDLGFNEIGDLGFVSDLPPSVSILNLTRNHIEYVDFGLFGLPLAELDLSFNKIVGLGEIHGFQVMRYLALNNNNISEIRVQKYWRSFEELDLNLACNNLMILKNIEHNQAKIRVKSINLDRSVSNVNVLKDAMAIFSPSKLIMTNNELRALDGNFIDCSQCTDVDFSNCSLSSIRDTLFQNSVFNNLNFSHNNLRLFNSSLFARSTVQSLDLSYNKIETIRPMLQDATVTIRYLNLSHNRISKLEPEFFVNFEGIEWLDLSFNDLKALGDGGFVNCIGQLSFLNLASNNLTSISERAFEGLSVPGILNLENNWLRNLSTNVFKPLKMAGVVNLRNNQISTLQSHLFDSIPVSSIILSGNPIETIQSKAFHNISDMREIHIDNNNVCCNTPMTIEEGAFSGLHQVDLVTLKNSKIHNISSNIFSDVKRLNTLDIRDNNITYTNFSSHTHYMTIGDIRLTINGDIQPKTFAKVIRLRHLSFWHSKIRNIANQSFQGLFHLRTLRLIDTTIEGHLESESFKGLFALTDFTGRSFLEGQSPLNSFMFQDFLSLQSLNLSFIGLVRIMPFAFSGMKRLDALYLDHNKINFLAKSAFSGLERLEILDLSHNQLTALRRDDFLGLSGLKNLNVSNNNISDMELGSLQNFPYLEALFVANNNLTELKIGAFSNLYHLKTLDISQNKISSLLFESFVPLKSLSDLNLEFNNLKIIQHISLVSNLKLLRRIRIANNRWKCDFLSDILVTFRNHSIDYSSENLNYFEDNIEGIHCIDVCKYLFCLQDSHGIN